MVSTIITSLIMTVLTCVYVMILLWLLLGVYLVSVLLLRSELLLLLHLRLVIHRRIKTWCIILHLPILLRLKRISAPRLLPTHIHRWRRSPTRIKWHSLCNLMILLLHHSLIWCKAIVASHGLLGWWGLAHVELWLLIELLVLRHWWSLLLAVW